MELSKEQFDILNSDKEVINLVSGYSGVGKSVMLLKKFKEIKENLLIEKEQPIIVVQNELKKKLLIKQSLKLWSEDISQFIYTFEELINYYIDCLKLPLFDNRITDERKIRIMDDIIYENISNHMNFDLETLLTEITYIQNNICLNEKTSLQKTLEKELQTYLLTARKSTIKGLLTFKEKQYIWNIYTKYLLKALNQDFFDDDTFYQSFLRLIYHQYDQNEMALKYKNILIDDVQDFTRVQLDILYHLLDCREDFYVLLTEDELKSFDRSKSYKNSLLFTKQLSIYPLTINYRNSKNVFEIIKSNISHNELLNVKLQYNSQKIQNQKSTLTFFYYKHLDEKLEVFFDRIDLLTNIMNYKLNDILIIFYDNQSYNELYRQCKSVDIPVIKLEDKINHNADGLVFMRKHQVRSVEFKVVMLYDADDKKICSGPVNKVSNLTNNYMDSLLFYLSITNATDFLIINSSISEPSTLLLPSNINYNLFVFEIGSHFQIKLTLNIYRITDFVSWIKEQLVQFYHYKVDNFETHPLFDIVVQRQHEKVAIKILDNNIDDNAISGIIKQGLKYQYIVIFDNHHYIIFQNKRHHFERIMDIPMALD